jgi:hypothetical protein
LIFQREKYSYNSLWHSEDIANYSQFVVWLKLADPLGRFELNSLKARRSEGSRSNGSASSSRRLRTSVKTNHGRAVGSKAGQ